MGAGSARYGSVDLDGRFIMFHDSVGHDTSILPFLRLFQFSNARGIDLMVCGYLPHCQFDGMIYRPGGLDVARTGLLQEYLCTLVFQC